MKISEQLDSAVQEAQRVDPELAWPGKERKTKPGSFKVSSKELDFLKKAANGKGPDAIFFKRQKDLINNISREDLAKVVGKDNIPDAQDFIAYKPRQAFQRFLVNIGKYSSKLGKALRGTHAPMSSMVFYMVMMRLSGRMMADIVFKRYFETESGHPGEFHAGFERKKKEAERLKQKHGKFQGAGI